MPTEVFLDFDSDPGLQPCDRCHRIKLTQWFAGMLLCQECLADPGVESIGFDAVGKAAERLSAVWRQNQEMRKMLGGVHQFLEGVLERCEAWATKIEDLLSQVRGG